MTAFGPYAGEEVIDFRKIHENSLFLVTGPTGSGKTTIFDAICYVLYGETSGNQRSGESLRSDFAPKSILTGIEFQFSLRGKDYLVERKPKQERAKARGEGTTTEKPFALFKEIGSEKLIVGQQNVNEAVKDLIGLTAEQFRQIMMIPQGSFQKFILANSEERSKILKTLFDTSLYGLIQFKLNEESNILRSKINNEIIRRDEKFRRIKRPIDSDLDILLKQEEILIDEIKPLLNKLIEDDLLNIKLKEKEILDLKNKKNMILKEKEQGLNNNELIHKLQRSIEELELLNTKKEEINKFTVRIEKANKLVGLIPLEEQKNELELKLDGLNTEHLLLIEKSKLSKENLKKLEKSVLEINSHERKEYLENLRENISKLKRYEEKVSNYKTLEKDYINTEKEYENITLKCNSVEENKNMQFEKINGLNLSLEGIEKLRLEQQKKNNQQLKLENILGQIRTLYKMLDKEIKLDTELLDASSKLVILKKDEISFRNIYNQAENNIKINTAAVLAKGLKDHEPCPVCGSIEHVKLAGFPPEICTDSELLELKNKYEDTHNKVTKEEYKIQITENQIKENIKEKEDFIEELKEKGKWLSLVPAINKESVKQLGLDIQKQVKELLIDMSKLEAQLDNKSELQKNLDEIKIKYEKSELAIKELDEKLNAIHNKMVSSKTLLKETEKEVPEEYLKISDFKKIISKSSKELTEKLEEEDNLKSKYHKLEIENKEIEASINYQKKVIKQLKEELETISKKFTLKKEETKIFDEAEYNKLKTDLKDIKLLEEKVKEYKEKLLETKSNINSLKSQINNKELVDLSSLEQIILELDNKIDTLTEEKNNLLIGVSDNNTTIDEIEKISFGIKDIENEYSVIGKLSRVANGKNSKKLSFERYVLAAFLEDILKAANSRLMKMTDQRYKLKRYEDVLDKRMAGGLDLQVFDYYTGISRHVNTLSGGESFKASLAMALGLSDIVQAYAGGIRLDTMFIDEGFGTLDSESLDQAVECLIEIQKTGRLVGIISHVDDLKERIKTKLEITSTNSGSKSNNFG